MNNLVSGIKPAIVLLTSEQDGLTNRIFGLDAQTLFDAVILALAVGFLFFVMSYLLFNPARELMKKRQEKIRAEMDTAAKDMADAKQMKSEYDAKLAAADKDVEVILSEGRRKALERENEIIAEAKEEAVRVRARAEREIELEKNKARDEVKQEIIGVAKEMAARVVELSLDDAAQEKLLNDALNEMGEDTWQR